MCSSQLYSKWRLHVPDHKDWQVVHRIVNLLEEGLCDEVDNILFFEACKLEYSVFTLTCQRQNQNALFSIIEETVCHTNGRKFRSEVIWSGITKDQLWHRLASAPDIVSASCCCTYQVPPEEAKVKKAISALEAMTESQN